MARPLVLDVVPVASPVHRVRAEVKLVGLVLVSVSVAFAPGWWGLAAGGVGALGAARAARLPRTVLPTPPAWLAAFALGGGVTSLLAGGEPVVGGVALGGVLDLARLLVVGLLLLACAALVAWTTPLTDVAAGASRLLGPLRRFRPGRELGTVIALTVRCVPLLAGELRTVVDARRTRPRPRAEGRRRRIGREIADVGAVVVVGAHRRAGEMALAMAARGSSAAPVPEPLPFRRADAVALLAVATVAAVILSVG